MEQPVAKHGHAVTHRHRLDLIVGDVHGGDAEPPLQRGDLGAGLDAQLGVEVGQRFVHQEDLGLADDGAPHRHPLALPARQLGGLAIEVVGDIEDRRRLADASHPLLLLDALDLEMEADVLGDGHVRVERVRLEHHRDVAVAGRQVGDFAIADEHGSFVDRLEPGEHPERGRLAAPGRADQHQELTVGDLEVEGVDSRAMSGLVDAGGLLEGDGGH